MIKPSKDIKDEFRMIILRCWEPHGPFDHKIEGRNRGFADVFEVLYENIGKIEGHADAESMIGAFGSMTESRMLRNVSVGVGDGYDEGYNEALRIGKILFRMYAKQKIFNEKRELSP